MTFSGELSRYFSRTFVRSRVTFSSAHIIYLVSSSRLQGNWAAFSIRNGDAIRAMVVEAKKKKKTDAPIDVLAPAPSSCDASVAQELRSMRLALEFNVHSQEQFRQDSNARDIRNDQTLRAVSQDNKEALIQISADNKVMRMLFRLL